MEMYGNPDGPGGNWFDFFELFLSDELLMSESASWVSMNVFNNGVKHDRPFI